MPILSLIAVATILQTQSAPADVPKDHWAFPAVDALFREGLLKGYPSGKLSALNLDRSVKPDLKQAERWIERWTKKGMFDNSLGSGYVVKSTPPSAYEAAVVAHMTLINSATMLKDAKTSTEQRLSILEELPRIAQVISMFEPELIKLGADVSHMMRRLNDLYDSPHRLFHGDR